MKNKKDVIANDIFGRQKRITLKKTKIELNITKKKLLLALFLFPSIFF